MKNKIFSLFSLFIVGQMIISCTNNGDDVSPIIQIAKPTMTIGFSTAVTVTEGTSIPVTFTLSAPVGKSFNVYINLDSPNSTAGGEDSDISETNVNTTFQKLITIPPFVTTFSSVVDISDDELTEGTETLKLSLGDTRTSAVIFQPVLSTITITNKVSDDLVLDFNFNKTFFGQGGYSNKLCDIRSSISNPANKPYDIDFIVYDNDYNAVTYTGSAGAQTGNCTESLKMNVNDYPNGLYHITALLFTNADLDFADLTFPLIGTPQFDIPISVDYLRAGSINKGTYNQEAANYLNSNSAELDEVFVVDVLVSTVAGVKKFTIQNSAGVVSASGRMATKGKAVSKHHN